MTIVLWVIFLMFFPKFLVQNCRFSLFSFYRKFKIKKNLAPIRRKLNSIFPKSRWVFMLSWRNPDPSMTNGVEIFANSSPLIEQLSYYTYKTDFKLALMDIIFNVDLVWPLISKELNRTLTFKWFVDLKWPKVIPVGALWYHLSL